MSLLKNKKSSFFSINMNFTQSIAKKFTKAMILTFLQRKLMFY